MSEKWQGILYTGLTLMTIYIMVNVFFILAGET